MQAASGNRSGAGTGLGKTLVTVLGIACTDKAQMSITLSVEYGTPRQTQ